MTFRAVSFVALVLLLILVGGCSEEPKAQPPTTAPRTLVGEREQPSDCVASASAAASTGKRVTVCGVVSGASYESGVSGKPTFINFDKPYPNHTFTVLIWGDKRDRFSPPAETQFGNGKRVCVTGLVEMYKGKPEIVVSSPDQIKVC